MCHNTLSMVVFSEDIEPDVIKEFNFTDSNEEWYTFGGGNLLWDEDKGYVYANNKSKSWVSPAVNIYKYIKAGGAGTYCINAIVDYNFSLENSVTARMVIRSDREYSFIPEHNGLFYKGIGTKTILYDSPWTEMSGTFKVTEEDLRASSGEFILCFDSLFDNFAEGMLKVDDVTICKLDTTNITNGDFWHNEIGWRNWGGFGNFYASYQAESGGFFNFAHYMKASTYGSIACNVDQILEHYGCTTYTLRLSMKIPAESYEHLDRMCFFLSAGDNSFHYNMGYKTKAQLSTSAWTDIRIDVNMNIVPNGQTKNLYELLSPDTNEVFFRIEYRSDNSTQSSDEGYLITRVNFTPLSQVGSISFNKKTIIVDRGWSGYLSYTAYPSGRNITWESSDPNIVYINPQSGLIYARKSGTVTITAFFDNGIYAKCTIKVIKYREFNSTQSEKLKSDFINLVGYKKADIVASDLIYIHSTAECIDIVLEHDDVITEIANAYNINKAFIQTILFRELWCLNQADILGDNLVESYFSWKDACEFWENQNDIYKATVDYPTPPIIQKEDSSVGLGQIFARVAIKAYNEAIDRGTISGTKKDKDNWKDCKEVWFNLRDDNEYNIRMSSLNILSCVDEFGFDNNYLSYTPDQCKLVFTRYNANQHTINDYAEACYTYYQIFTEYLFS